jgi:hypothetical protein
VSNDYNRFHNTAILLEECFDCINDDLSNSESRARNKLIKLCMAITENQLDLENQEEYDSEEFDCPL